MFPKLSDMKKIRERIGWSQTELANKIGKSQSLIPKYENGKQIPSYEIATKIFSVLLKEDMQVDLDISEIMTTKILITSPDTNLKEVRELMSKHSISQLPVVDNGLIVGSIHESIWLDLLDSYNSFSSLNEEKVVNVMGDPLPTVPRSAKVKEVSHLLRHYKAIIVVKRGEIEGIVTIANLLDVEY